MDLRSGRRNRVPVAQMVRRTLKAIEPHAQDLGSAAELEGVRDILARGSSADRQLATFERTGDLKAVVDQLIQETSEGVVA